MIDGFLMLSSPVGIVNPTVSAWRACFSYLGAIPLLMAGSNNCAERCSNRLTDGAVIGLTKRLEDKAALKRPKSGCEPRI